MIFLSVDASAPAYIHKLARDISILLAGRRLDTFSVTKLPSAVPAAQIIFIPDESGGPTPAFSDGAAWRRTSDNAVVS